MFSISLVQLATFQLYHGHDSIRFSGGGMTIPHPLTETFITFKVQ